MSPSYVIDVDPQTSFVTIEVAGFFDAPALARFAAAREEAYKALRCRPHDHVTLCDVTECQLQSQVIVAGFQQIIADPDRRSRRLAFVVGTSLARMQIRRMVAGRTDVQTFADRNEATAWLREPEPAQLAAVSGAGRRA